jgi:hypothetical protein
MVAIQQKWNLVSDMKHAGECQVFSGGACNIRDGQGRLLRNRERDGINDWLTEQNVLFYDPQIHPDTHGREYEYEVDSRLEVATRKASRINLFEISPRTLCGVTSVELAVDKFEMHHPTVIFFSDGNDHKDVIPKHSKDGYPLFVPYGIGEDENEDAKRAHYQECIKNANRMRQYLVKFAQELGGLTISFGEQAYEGDVMITPNRLHVVDIFQAVIRAASGKRVNVIFTGEEDARDAKGNPLFMPKAKPKPVDIDALLDQYVEEGNALRRAICDLTTVNVLTRVVYTQRAVINVLDDLTKLVGVR